MSNQLTIININNEKIRTIQVKINSNAEQKKNVERRIVCI